MLDLCKRCGKGEAQLLGSPCLKAEQAEAPSDSTLKLAEMILADCGHSTAITTRLRDRVAERIERHIASQPTASNADAATWDECVASGQSCEYGPHGPNGEQQCRHCGSEPTASNAGEWEASQTSDDPDARVRGWLRAALSCEGFAWDEDQRECAEADLAAALSTLPLQAGQKPVEQNEFSNDPELTVEAFSTRLTEFMRRGSLSAKDVNEITGVSESTLSRLKNHGRMPDAVSYAALCNMMGWHPYLKHKMAAGRARAARARGDGGAA